jgi:prepilin-type N-terminal cleavage/methylation domain-containing protein
MKNTKNLFCKSLKSANKGFSLVELLIVIVILGILASLSVLYIFSARRNANNASALSTLRTIHQSQASYSAGVGNGLFGSQTELFVEEYIDAAVGAACIPLPTQTSKGGLQPPTEKPKSGFVFTIVPVNQPNLNTYTATARPLITTGQSRSGDSTFFIDQTGVLRSSTTASDNADANSSPLNN